MDQTFPPFCILALAPFTSVPDNGHRGDPIPVDLTSLDQALTALAPRFTIPVSRELCPQAELIISLTALKDFRPENLVKSQPYLAALDQARRLVAENQAVGGLDRLAARLRAEFPLLPPDILTPPAAPTWTAEPANAVDDILSMVASPATPVPASSGPRDWAGRLNQALGRLLAEIFNSPEWRSHETAWRGLEMLVKQGPVKAGSGPRVEIFPMSPGGLEAALATLAPRLISQPPHLLLVDLPLDNTPVGVGLLENLLNWADHLLAPTVGWIGPRFFQVTAWPEMAKVAYLKHHLEDAAWAKWRKLKDAPGAAWTTMTAGRILARPAFGPRNQARPVPFAEETPTWLSPVWAVGTLVAQSVALCGWPTRFTDYRQVMLRDLPLADLDASGPRATDLTLSEDRLMEFLDVGLTPVLGPLRKDVAFIPKETTLAGGALKYQMLVARILGFLFWLRENSAGPAGREGPDLAAAVRQALACFWEQTGQKPPTDLEVTAGPPAEGTVPLEIGLTPGSAILPGAQRLEFTFRW